MISPSRYSGFLGQATSLIYPHRMPPSPAPPAPPSRLRPSPRLSLLPAPGLPRPPGRLGGRAGQSVRARRASESEMNALPPRSMSGVFGFGSATCSCSDSRPEPPAPRGSQSISRSDRPVSCPVRSCPALRSCRAPAAPLAGFSLVPRLALFVPFDSVAAVHRVRGAYDVIVAPLVARVAAEHGFPDGRGRSRCPTVGPFPDSSRFYVEFREAGTFAVSDLNARLHIITPPDRPMRRRRGRGRAPARSSAAPRCRSAASPP